MSVVTLYGKPGCHLCEEAREALLTVRRDRAFVLREIDVSLDPVLHRHYGERIPVVAVDGEEAFQFRVDPAELHRLLGGGPPAAR